MTLAEKVKAQVKLNIIEAANEIADRLITEIVCKSMKALKLSEVKATCSVAHIPGDAVFFIIKRLSENGIKAINDTTNKEVIAFIS